MIEIISDLLMILLLLTSNILVILATVLGVFVLLDMIKDYKSKCVCSEEK